MDLISIVVPVYNVKDYLGKCLNSLLSQTYENLEIIIVDDGSTDGSNMICDKYAKTFNQIKVIHKKNGGLSDARNVGIEKASGRYITFVDSDDVIESNMIEYLYGLTQKYNAEIGICDPVHCYSNENIDFLEAIKETIFSSEEAIIEMLYQKSFLVAAWGKIYLTEWFKDIKFPVGMLFEDSAVMYKLFDKADVIVYGNAKLYGYMHRENSITTKAFSKRDLDILVICNQIEEYFSNRSVELQKAARSYKAAGALRVYLNSPNNGEFDSEICGCKQFLSENTNKLLSDHRIRKKMRYALLLFKYAKIIMPFFYRKINRWK